MKRPKSTKIIESDSSSGSESEEEWDSRAKRAKRVGVESSNDSSPSEPEEGELSSDGEDEDDGLDEDLMGDEADRLRLAEMTEKEREEELFKRAELREAMKARKSVKEKLREGRRRQQMMKEKEREKKRSQASQKARPEASRTSSAGGGSGNAAGGTSRQKALEEKRGGANKFAQLIERRKAKLKTSEIFSDEDDESSSSSSSSGNESDGGSDVQQQKKERREKKVAGGSKEKSHKARSRIRRRDSSAGSSNSSKGKAIGRSSSSDSSSSSRSRSRSRSSSAAVASEDGECRRSDSSDENGSTDGRWPGRQSRKNALIENREDLMRARLSRFKMEKWVHMPFFKDLVIGCFVRVGIGNKDGHAIYRIAQIEDVVETGKIYDLGTTRTNRGLILRHGDDRQMFRLCFLSNQDFSPSEWDKWLMSMTAASLTLPTRAFVMKKEEEIARATEHRIEDDAELERILDEKKRFRRGPLNYTLQKMELMKDRQLAENEGDSSRVARITMEMTDLESEANERERKRTMQIKSISYINERNRAQNLKLAEEASKREFEEMEQMQKNGVTDPFSRLQTRPVLFGTKRKPAAPSDQPLDQAQPQLPQHPPIQQAPRRQQQSRPQQSPTKQLHCNHRTSEKSNHSANDGDNGAGDVFSIHNFDINIDIDMPMSAPLPPSVPVSSVSSSGLVTATADLSTQPTLGTSRRGLNLEEYKKRRGLI